MTTTMTATTEMQSCYTTTTTLKSRAPTARDELPGKYTPSMTTTSTSLRNKSRNPFHRVVDRLRLGYYRYEVTFGLYVMTPSEKCVANSFVVVVLSLLLWALLLYFPSLLFNKLIRVEWLLTGHTSEVGTALGRMDMHGYPITPASTAETHLAS